MQIKKRKN